MATRNFENAFRNEVQSILCSVNRTFDDMIIELNRKRREIISEISREFEEIDSQRAANFHSIDQIEDMMKLFEESFHQNNLYHVRDMATEQFDQKLRELRSEEIKFDLIFFASDITKLRQFLNENYSLSRSLFELGNSLNSRESNVKIQYSQKKRAKMVIGETGSRFGKLNAPMKLTFDTDNGHLYVPDANNKRIQVFRTDGECINEFGSEILRFPCSVATDITACYIADSLGRVIYKLTIPHFEFIAEQKYTPGCLKTELSYPVDIKINFENDCVYVADLENERVCIFNSELDFKSEIGKGYLKKPQYLQFYGRKLFVLDAGGDYFLHQFDRNGRFDLSIPKQGPEYQIMNPKSFCFDPECGYILVTDFDADTIKIFSFLRSNALKLEHKIGKENPLSEVVDGCMGIVLVDGNIIVSCQRPQSCLKII